MARKLKELEAKSRRPRELRLRVGGPMSRRLRVWEAK